MGKLGLVEKVATWEDFYIFNRKDASLEQWSLSVGTWIDNVDLSTQSESLLESSLATVSGQVIVGSFNNQVLHRQRTRGI